MTLSALRAYALSLPQASLVRQWGDAWVFKVGGKLFLVVSADGDIPVSATFKPTPAERKDLEGRDGLRPAPYLARAGWLMIDDLDSVSSRELCAWIRGSYEAACARLGRRRRAELGLGPGS